jgi:hypothetical protein
LVKNLDNPDYVKILLDGKADIEELFADLEAKPLADTIGSETNTNRILPGFRVLTSSSTLPVQLVGLFSKAPTMNKSNQVLWQ